MRGCRFVAIEALALVLVGAGAAFAQDGGPPANRQRIGIDFGFASAVGIVGVDYQFAPVSWFRLEGGAGWGPTGAQVSLMPKVALGHTTCAFTAGFGASVAVGGHPVASGPGHGPSPDAIPWLNLDLPGVECRVRSGFSLQAALGATMPLADFHWDFTDLGDTVHAGSILPQLRVGIGWWF